MREIELKPVYIIQVTPRILAVGWKSIGFEDIETSNDAEEAYYLFKRAKESGNYNKVRIVKLCAFEVSEVLPSVDEYKL